jgi:hypothetical protein
MGDSAFAAPATYPLAITVPAAVSVPTAVDWSAELLAFTDPNVGPALNVAPMHNSHRTGNDPVTSIASSFGSIRVRVVNPLNVSAGRRDAICVRAPLAAFTVCSSVENV